MESNEPPFINYPEDKKGVVITLRLYDSDYEIVKEVFNDEPTPLFTIISSKRANSGMTDVEIYFELFENMWFLAKRVGIREAFKNRRK